MRYLSKLGSACLIGLGVAVMSLGLGLASARAQSDTTENASTTVEVTPPVITSTAPRSGKPYFVEFRARSAASYGHMYVLYGQVNGRGEIIKSDIAGLHPAGDSNNCENCSVVSWTLGHFLFVPAETGASDGDLEEKYVAARYRVMLDAASYKKVAAYIKKLQAESPQWNALWRNCVSFGRDIAQFMDLKMPPAIWQEPKDFVENLRELNGSKKQGPLKDAPYSAKASVSSLQSPSTASAPLPQKPKKQPMANSSAAAGVAPGAVR